MSGLGGPAKRWLLWDFKRGSPQYDVIVALILAFIFFVPQEFFRAEPKAAQAVMLPNDGAAAVFWIESEALAGVGAGGRDARVSALVRDASKGKAYKINRIQAVPDSENEIRGYMAFASAVE